MTNITKHSAPTPPAKLDAFLDQLATQLPRSGKLIFGIDATATVNRRGTGPASCRAICSRSRRRRQLEIQLVYYPRVARRVQNLGWMTDSKSSPPSWRRSCAKPATRRSEKSSITSTASTTGSLLPRSCSLATPWRRSSTSSARSPASCACRLSCFRRAKTSRRSRVPRDRAKITHGAYARFDAGAADQLRDLLKAVAAYAVGGRQALEKSTNTGAVLLLKQLKS